MGGKDLIAIEFWDSKFIFILQLLLFVGGEKLLDLDHR